MNIHAKKGDKVIYKYPGNGYAFDRDTAKRHLILNQKYTVERTDVMSYVTYIYLREFPGVGFNSVMFEDV